jgi:hypothetical protein
VAPDHFYERFFRSLLASGAGAGAPQIHEALERAPPVDVRDLQEGSAAHVGLAAGMKPASSVLRRQDMPRATNETTGAVAVPRGLAEREAELVLGALARVKARRFGRLVVTVNDGRMVDVEVIEKLDRDVLKGLSM